MTLANVLVLSLGMSASSGENISSGVGEDSGFDVFNLIHTWHAQEDDHSLMAAMVELVFGIIILVAIVLTCVKVCR